LQLLSHEHHEHHGHHEGHHGGHHEHHGHHMKGTKHGMGAGKGGKGVTDNNNHHPSTPSDTSPQRRQRNRIDKKQSMKVHQLLQHEKFVPGVDNEVKDWLALRRSYFAARDSAKKTETIASEILYRIPYFWAGEIKKEMKPDKKKKQHKEIADGNEEGENGENEKENDDEIELDEEEEDEENEEEVEDDNNGVIDGMTPLESFEYKLQHPNEYTQEELMQEAINARHTRFIDLALRSTHRRININCRIDSMGRTALHLAAFRGDLKKLQKLIEYGADMDVQDTRLDTPLHCCIRILPEAFKADRICKTLLKRKANIHLRNKSEQTALHQACIVGDLRFIDPLLQAGSDVYALDIHGKLPLQYCKKQKEAVYIFSCHERLGWKRSRHTLMWSHILAREFVSHVFK
jgi:ankyrin repeat protein